MISERPADPRVPPPTKGLPRPPVDKMLRDGDSPRVVTKGQKQEPRR